MLGQVRHWLLGKETVQCGDGGYLQVGVGDGRDEVVTHLFEYCALTLRPAGDRIKYPSIPKVVWFHVICRPLS